MESLLDGVVCAAIWLSGCWLILRTRRHAAAETFYQERWAHRADTAPADPRDPMRIAARREFFESQQRDQDDVMYRVVETLLKPPPPPAPAP